MCGEESASRPVKGKALTQEEAIGVTTRWRKYDDKGDCPLQSQSGERRVERSVAGEELREREHTLATELLVDTTLPKLRLCK